MFVFANYKLHLLKTSFADLPLVTVSPNFINRAQRLHYYNNYAMAPPKLFLNQYLLKMW
jgi:hypothetical protein